jgi:hypothetical protein
MFVFCAKKLEGEMRRGGEEVKWRGGEKDVPSKHG